MKPVTTATSNNLGYRCSGIDEVVVVVFCEILGFWKLFFAATEFSTCQKTCYNCYNMIFILMKVSTVKGFRL